MDFSGTKRPLHEPSSAPARNSFTKVEVTQADRPESPDPLVEDDDMVMVAPPCHSWEPVKIPTDAAARFYCLICGHAYAV